MRHSLKWKGEREQRNDRTVKKTLYSIHCFATRLSTLLLLAALHEWTAAWVLVLQLYRGHTHVAVKLPCCTGMRAWTAYIELASKMHACNVTYLFPHSSTGLKLFNAIDNASFCMWTAPSSSAMYLKYIRFVAIDSAALSSDQPMHICTWNSKYFIDNELSMYQHVLHATWINHANTGSFIYMLWSEQLWMEYVLPQSTTLRSLYAPQRLRFARKGIIKASMFS